jgi:hypothetical protein
MGFISGIVIDLRLHVQAEAHAERHGVVVRLFRRDADEKSGGSREAGRELELDPEELADSHVALIDSEPLAQGLDVADDEGLRTQALRRQELEGLEEVLVGRVLLRERQLLHLGVPHRRHEIVVLQELWRSVPHLRRRHRDVPLHQHGLPDLDGDLLDAAQVQDAGEGFYDLGPATGERELFPDEPELGLEVVAERWRATHRSPP